MPNDPADMVTIDPAVCHGKPCVRGTRILVTTVLDSLASGDTEAEIMAEYPSLTTEGIRGALAYGSWLVKQPRWLALKSTRRSRNWSERSKAWTTRSRSRGRWSAS